MQIPFQKKFKTLEEIVALLKERGLIFDDESLAIGELGNIGYYRFSAYLYPFLEEPKENQIFKENSNFQTALSLYCFDCELRMLIFDVIATVEISIRSALANIIAYESGNIFWTTDPEMFRDEEQYKKTMSIIDKELNGSKEDFIIHFREKYDNAYPPAWMLVEILPMGVLNHIYYNLKSSSLRKKVAARYSLPAPIFSSWFTVVILTRNSCCHHARLWNKENAISPSKPRKMSCPWISDEILSNRLFYNLSILKFFMNQINEHSDFKNRLLQLFSDFPMVDIRALGFPKDWENEPLWEK